MHSKTTRHYYYYLFLEIILLLLLLSCLEFFKGLYQVWMGSKTTTAQIQTGNALHNIFCFSGPWIVPRARPAGRTHTSSRVFAGSGMVGRDMRTQEHLAVSDFSGISFICVVSIHSPGTLRLLQLSSPMQCKAPQA